MSAEQVCTCRSQHVLYGAADVGLQACLLPLTMPAWGRLAPNVAASGTAADSAGSLHGRSNGCVPHGPLSHVAGSISQCSIAPLQEIPFNTNHYVSASEQGVFHASEGDRAGIDVSHEAKPRGPARQYFTDSCRVDMKGALKLRPCTGREFNVVCGSSSNTTSSGNSRTGQQRSASNQPKDPASTQALRQLQGRCNRNMSEPNMPPRHGHRSSMGQQNKCQGLESNGGRNQAATAVQSERGHKASSSTADKRKALMKAIVRTTPTRAPCLLPEAAQLSGSTTANKPNSIAWCRGVESVCSQSCSVSCAMSSQSQRLLTGQLQGKAGFVLPCPALNGLEARSRSDALGGLSSAESGKASADWVSASGLQIGKNVSATILGSAERRAVKRSLLSQPDFC